MIFFWLTFRQYVNERGNTDVQPFESKFLFEFNRLRMKRNFIIIVIELSELGNEL